MKRKGQHFLIDRGVIDRIISYAELSPDDRVLEIGPGTGNLTEALALHAGSVYAIEADPVLAGKLRELQDRLQNVIIKKADALKVDFQVDFPDCNKIVSNLPYQISSKITYRILSSPFDMAVLMYQKEFAGRLTAAPGSEEYGRMGMVAGYLCEAEILEIVPRHAFKPMPEVRSAIVRLRPKDHQVNAEQFMKFAEALFNFRRKKVKWALAALGIPAERLTTMNCALLDRRPEELSPEEAAFLAMETGQETGQS